MIIVDLLSGIFLLAGLMAFAAGVVGLLRFPDIYTRLHALTKADNIGLGFVVLALSFQLPGWLVVAKYLVIWLFVMAASTVACHLVAKRAMESGLTPWRAGK